MSLPSSLSPPLSLSLPSVIQHTNERTYTQLDKCIKYAEYSSFLPFFLSQRVSLSPNPPTQPLRILLPPLTQSLYQAHPLGFGKGSNSTSSNGDGGSGSRELSDLRSNVKTREEEPEPEQVITVTDRISKY